MIQAPSSMNEQIHPPGISTGDSSRSPNHTPTTRYANLQLLPHLPRVATMLSMWYHFWMSYISALSHLSPSLYSLICRPVPKHGAKLSTTPSRVHSSVRVQGTKQIHMRVVSRSREAASPLQLTTSAPRFQRTERSSCSFLKTPCHQRCPQKAMKALDPNQRPLKTLRGRIVLPYRRRVHQQPQVR